MLGTAFAEARRVAGIATPLLAPICLWVAERLAPGLSAADETALVRRYLAGDRAAGDALLHAHHGLIRSIAHRRSALCAVLEEGDLEQSGRIGFLASLKDYDPARGTLRQWAPLFVSRAIQETIDAEDGTIEIPRRQHMAIRRALKSGGLSGKLQALSLLRRAASLDEPMDEDDDRTPLECLSGFGRTPEDVMIAIEEAQGRPMRARWQPDKPGYAAEDDNLSDRVRYASRGRVAA